MKDKAIIIGSGLGGLECGYILAKHGFDVTVLERTNQIGGCLQTFTRGSARFDTGFHYVGALDQGQPLWRLFRYFGLVDLPWHRLDKECFDEVVIGGESFHFANGHKEFAARLAERFPSQRANLEKYTGFLKNVGDHIFDSFGVPLLHTGGDDAKGSALGRNAADFFSTSLFSRSAYDFLCETIDDPLLRKVLSGTSLKMQLNADSLPLYVFAQINNSFIQSAWRLQGGGTMVAERLSTEIEEMGGRVLINTEVVEIKSVNGHVSRVVVADGREFEADWVLSDIHPAATVALVKEGLRNIYRSRMSSLRNTYGTFTVNIALKKGAMPYLNRNIFIHSADVDLWHPSPRGEESLLVSYPVPREGSDGSAVSVDLMASIAWSEVEKWADRQPGRRGVDYAEFKEQRAGECIDFAGTRLPELRGAIEKIYVSTPLTYNSYLAAPQGSAYGIVKDWKNPMTTVLTPRTPISGLLLTGQSLNLHGILGVSMTSVFTCAMILGMEDLAREVLRG